MIGDPFSTFLIVSAMISAFVLGVMAIDGYYEKKRPYGENHKHRRNYD